MGVGLPLITEMSPRADPRAGVREKSFPYILLPQELRASVPAREFYSAQTLALKLQRHTDRAVVAGLVGGGHEVDDLRRALDHAPGQRRGNE